MRFLFFATGTYCEKAITAVHYVTPQLVITALVSDGHPSNRSCFNKLKKKYGTAEHDFFTTTLKNGQKSKIFLFSCFTHLIKTIRNSMFANKFQFSWDLLKQLKNTIDSDEFAEQIMYKLRELLGYRINIGTI